jgi:hypothetical protein
MTASIVQFQEKDLTKFAAAIQGLAQGRSNAVGVVTLRASQTTTTVLAPNCGAGSAVFLFPQTANAAAVVASTYILAANVAPGNFVITHPSNSNTDKTFSYVCLG